GGRRVHRSAYRPDPWRAPEWIVAGGGVLCAVTMFLRAGYDVTDLNPSLYPLTWPDLPMAPVLGILLAGAAAMCAPPAVRRRPAQRPSATAAKTADPERVPA
ncbi:MAG: energy-coupling factor transporter transmembrane protein EcfT, partial [Jatrophihabitans sp.]